MENSKIIIKVCLNKSNGQLFCTIPRRCGLKPGDYILVRKLETMDLNGNVTIGLV